MATADELLAFLARPWSELRAAKDRYTAARLASESADAAFEMAEMLRAHADAMGARLTTRDRNADLAAAVRLKRLLDRASKRSARAT
jgi:hypothetical protein